MRITEIRVDMTFNLGNYQSEKIGFTAQVEEGENVLELRDELKLMCSLESARVTKPIDAYIAQVDAGSKANAEKIEEEIKEEPKKEKKARTVKPKFSPYDRTIELHKKLFSKTLDIHVAGWRKDSSKAKSASVLLEKESFLDVDGNVVEEFISKLVKAMSV